MFGNVCIYLIFKSTLVKYRCKQISIRCNQTLASVIFVFAEVGGVGTVDACGDWWSLGALLYELLTGMVREGGRGTQNTETNIVFVSAL